MKKNIKKEKGTLIIELTISGEEWKKEVTKAENKLIKEVKVKGFRKGQADPKIAKKMIDPYDAYKVALDASLDKHYSTLGNDLAKENVISKPNIEYIKASESEGVIKVTAVLYPEIKLPKLETLKSKRKAVKVTKADIKAELDNFQKQLMESKVFTDESKKVEKGDIVNLNFKGSINGKEFEGGSAEGYDLEIGSKSFIDNFEDQLIGLKTGDKKDVKVTFPVDYQVEEYRNKKAVFAIEILSIKSQKPLVGKELKERLNMFGFDSMEHLETEAERLIKKDRFKKENDTFRKLIIDEIANNKESKIDVPAALIETEAKHIWTQLEEQLKKNKMTVKQYLKQIGKTKEAIFEEQIIPEAKQRLVDTLIISEIARLAKIDIDEKEMEEILKKQAKEAKIPFEQYKEVAKDRMETLKINEIHDRVLEYLAKKTS